MAVLALKCFQGALLDAFVAASGLVAVLKTCIGLSRLRVTASLTWHQEHAVIGSDFFLLWERLFFWA